MTVLAGQIAEAAHDDATSAEPLADLGQRASLHFHGLPVEIADQTIAHGRAIHELVAREYAAKGDAAGSRRAADALEGWQPEIGDRFRDRPAQAGIEAKARA